MVFWDGRIGINVLQVDENNPRMHPSKDQQDAIDQMLYKNEKKIRNIARHIAEYGLNPSTLPIVFRNSEGKYIVKDGNRRITAIKCMMHPDKVKNNPILKRYLAKLGGSLDRTNFQFIECRISDDEAEINHWIEINHQGEQDGIGQTKWDAIAKLRHQRSIGNQQPNLDLFDYLMNKISYPMDEDEFDFTTFERMISNAAFKKAIGMETEGNEIVFNRPEEELLRDFEELFNDMTSAKNTEDHIDSRTMNTAEDIEGYVLSKKSKGFFEARDTTERTSVPINTEPWTPEKSEKKTVKRNSRKITMISGDCRIHLPKARMYEMFRDLTVLDLRKHNNSASAIFRTFFEMTTKYYHDEVMQTSDRHVDFHARVKNILKNLRNSGKITEDTKRSMELLLEKPNSMLVEFNQFGHNYEYNPDHSTLRAHWESVQAFVCAMYPPAEEDDDGTANN